jgi:hypothetical protein
MPTMPQENKHFLDSSKATTSDATDNTKKQKTPSPSVDLTQKLSGDSHTRPEQLSLQILQKSWKEVASEMKEKTEADIIKENDGIRSQLSKERENILKKYNPFIEYSKRRTKLWSDYHQYAIEKDNLKREGKKRSLSPDEQWWLNSVKNLKKHAKQQEPILLAETETLNKRIQEYNKAIDTYNKRPLIDKKLLKLPDREIWENEAQLFTDNGDLPTVWDLNSSEYERFPKHEAEPNISWFTIDQSKEQQELKKEFTRLTEQHQISYKLYETISYKLGQLVGKEHTYMAQEFKAENNAEQIEARNNRIQIIDQYNNLSYNFQQSYQKYANEILSYNKKVKSYKQRFPQSTTANEIQTHLHFMNIGYRQEAGGTTDMFSPVDWNVKKLDPLSPLRPINNNSDDNM